MTDPNKDCPRRIGDLVASHMMRMVVAEAKVIELQARIKELEARLLAGEIVEPTPPEATP